MSVAGLPAPARVSPPVEDDGAEALDPASDVFSATLRERVSQGEREERHARRTPVNKGAEGPGAVLAQLPAQPLPPVLGIGLGGVPAGNAGERGDRAPAVLAASATAGAASSTSSASSPPPTTRGDAEVVDTFTQAAQTGAAASTAASAPATQASPVPQASAPSLELTEAEALALRSSRGSPPLAPSAAAATAHARPAPAPSTSVLTSAPMSAPSVDPSAKSVTVVNQPASGTLTISDSSRGRLREATSFVANQAALRKGAVAELDLPELGRVVIRAVRGASGTVDVHITADRPETRGLLHASTAAMAADLADASVPLGQIQIDASNASSTPGDRGGTGDDIRREPAAARRPNRENDAPTPGGKRRVRIVL
jgi:hypothetical protein